MSDVYGVMSGLRFMLISSVISVMGLLVVGLSIR